MAEQGGETKVTSIKPALGASGNRMDIPGWQVKTTHLARRGHRFTPEEAGALLIFRVPLGQLPLVQETADAAFPDPGSEDLV